MMKNAVNWFEIPVADMDRAVRFYDALVGVPLKREHFTGRPTAVFPGEGVAGSLVHGDRLPTADGTIVYLNAGADLDGWLARAERAGAQVLLARTDIGEPGFIALIRDPEGNTVGLHQPR